MAGRPRILWQELEGGARPTVWTPGWLPDSEALRWSLANHFRVEGIRDGWHLSYLQADAVALRDSYVAVNDDGDWIEVAAGGTSDHDGTNYPRFRTATLAQLDDVDE